MLDTVLSMLAEGGTAAVTIDAIAVRARVSKATIYRHWQGKDSICREAVAAIEPATGPPCQHLAPEQALVQCARAFARALTAKQHGHCVANIAAAAAGDRNLHKIWEESVVGPHREVVALTVRAARARGLVRQGADPSLVADLVVAAVIHRVATHGNLGLEDYASNVAITVWSGLRVG